MDEVRLRPVALEQLSALKHTVCMSDDVGVGSPEFLIIRYEGIYRTGSAGSDDASYIMATAEAARRAWWTACTVLDLRMLQYTWGDEMEELTSIGWDRVTGCHAPLAIVVSDGCRAALKSLLEDEFDRFCVNTIEEAFSACRRQRVEWEAALKSWRDKV